MSQEKPPLFGPQMLWKGIVTVYMLALLVMGLLWPGGGSLVEGMGRVLTAPSVLLSDYMDIGGPGAALFNGGLVGLVGLLLLTMTNTAVSGPTIAAVFTMAGFSLFGKNPLNIAPIIMGVYLFSKARKEPFKMYIVVAMFGTSLGPLVSQVVFGFGLPWYVGFVAGVAIGFVLPALAPHLLHNHQGLNLYNVGFTTGIVGTLGMALLKGFGHVSQTKLHWSSEYSQPMFLVFFIYFASMILVGLMLKGTLNGFFEIQKLSGALVTDFTMHAGFPSTFINMGLVGLLGLLYLQLVGGQFNGPTLGGVFTMVGFGAFGKHIRNSVPIMAGVWLACLVLVPQASQPGPQLAALFGTTLAPIAGSFGPLVGVAAGFMHLATVMHVGVMHGGMNLYNNGLAGGLVATLFVSLARAFFQKR